MALVRCTCLYRTRPAESEGPHGIQFTVIARDPWCPADELHAQFADNAEQDELS